MSVQDMHERLKKANERRNCGADEEITRLRAEYKQLIKDRRDLQDTVMNIFCVVFNKPRKYVEDMSDAEFDELEKLACSRGQKPSDTVKSVFDELRAVNAELVRALRELQRCAQKQGFNDRYETTMRRVKAALSRAEPPKPEPGTCVWKWGPLLGWQSACRGMIQDSGPAPATCTSCGGKVEAWDVDGSRIEVKR